VNDSAPKECKKSLIRSSRFWFGISAVTALICILLFATWAATDASFRYGIYQAKISLRLQSIPSAAPELLESVGILDAMREIKWNSIGKRVIAISLLFSIGFTASSMLCYLTVRRFTLKRSVVCATVLFAWLSLYLMANSINYWCTQRQIVAIFPQFEQVGVALHKEWPTEFGEILPGKRFNVRPEDYPDILFLLPSSEPFPLHENFGFDITRGKNGIIRFGLIGAYDFNVEFHSNGSAPTEYISGFGNPSASVASFIQLKNNWFLVRYAGS